MSEKKMQNPKTQKRRSSLKSFIRRSDRMRATNHEGFFSHTQNPLTNQIPSFSFILRYHFLSFSRIPRLHVSFSFFHSRPSAPLCNSVAATIFIRSLTRHHNPHPNNFRALFLWSLAGHLFFWSICLCLLLI